MTVVSPHRPPASNTSLVIFMALRAKGYLHVIRCYKIALNKVACVSKLCYCTPFHDTKLSLVPTFQGRTCCDFIVDCSKLSYDEVISSRVTVRRRFSKMGPRLKVERGRQTGAQVASESTEIP